MGAPFDKSEYDPLVTFAYEQIVVSNAAVPCTAATQGPAGSPPAKRAVVIVETDAVRFRADGVAPTATVGMLLAVGDQMVFWGEDIRAVKFIRVTGDAKVNVEYAR